MSELRAVLRSRYFRRLFWGVAGVVLLVVAVQLVVILPRLRVDARAAVRERLLDQARLVRSAVRAGLPRDADWEQAVRDLARGSGIRLTLFASDGSILADSDLGAIGPPDPVARPEILDAKARGQGVAVRRRDELGQDVMFVALPLYHPSTAATPQVYVRTALPLARLDDRSRSLMRSTLWGAAAALTLGIVAAGVLARRAAAPVLDVAEAADAIAAGDYRKRIEVPREDEVGRLAAAFNTTCARLAEQLETITGDRNKLTAVLESMVEGVIAIDRRERILHVNAVVAELFDLGDPERLFGRPFYEATRVPEIAEALEEALRGERVLRTMRLEERSPARVLEVNAAPLRGAGLETIGAVVVLHDVTQLHKLEGIRRQFVSNVSHELKTPLTAIRGFVETLLDADEIDAATRRRFLERIRLQTNRLSSLVADLLSLSRIESTDGGAERRRVDLRAPLMESVRALRPAIEARGLELALDLPPLPVVVSGEEESLRQALSNLIDNAIKYSEVGAPVFVRLRQEGPDAVFEVEDRGAGIEPQHHQRIFERFYRVDRARSRDLGGTGLGLAIVKNVAQAFGGEVAVESQPGRGSLFRMKLPLAAGERVA
ncbi:MAG TPA: ATP-binding protein [Thermoanaerobaculia bacterium]|nr:ATP-binding protein [Thermoanaerobaculia bacterium]